MFWLVVVDEPVESTRFGYCFSFLFLNFVSRVDLVASSLFIGPFCCILCSVKSVFQLSLLASLFRIRTKFCSKFDLVLLGLLSILMFLSELC